MSYPLIKKLHQWLFNISADSKDEIKEAIEDAGQNQVPEELMHHPVIDGDANVLLWGMNDRGDLFEQIHGQGMAFRGNHLVRWDAMDLFQSFLKKSNSIKRSDLLLLYFI